MRELTTAELGFVAGGSKRCAADNSYGGVTNTSTVGDDIINIYEGLVQAASHIIERVAGAW